MRNEIKLGNLANGTPGKLVFFSLITGAPNELTLGTNLSITGSTLNATGGGGSGTITSVNVTGGTTGLTTSGGPIDSGNPSGTIIFAGTLVPNNGGTGIPGGYVTGDILSANASNSLTRIAAPALGNVLRSVAVGTLPQWGKVELTGSGKSVNGIMDFANGGLQFNTIAAGEIVYGSATNTMGKIALGSNGNVLTIVGGTVQWAAPSGGGSGTVTSVGLSLPAMFSVTGSPVTTTGTLTATLANQAINTVFAGPSSGGAAAPTFRTLTIADLPYTPWEDVTASTYTFLSTDDKKIKRFTNVGGCVVTIPTGLPTGWGSIAYRASGAGTVSFLSAGTYEAAGSALVVEKTMAFVGHRGSNIHVATGALTSGISNTAANNEIPKSNGTNLVPTGVFSPSTGQINATFVVAGDSTNNRLAYMNAGGSTSLFNFVGAIGTASFPLGVTLALQGGSGYSVGNNKGGGVYLRTGGGNGTAAPGDITFDTTAITAYIVIPFIPTSATGLPSGALWSNGGVLTRVP